jgi:Tfp pilus assembly protein PilF
MKKHPQNKTNTMKAEDSNSSKPNGLDTVVEPQDPPSEQLQSIINLYTQGQLQQALSHTTEMLERFPNAVTLYKIAGASNAGLMQFDAAIDNYKQALKINPDYAEVYINMGNALKDKGDLEAAIENYKKALKINPDYAAAYINMGTILQNKGDLEAAIENYKKALKINPDYVAAYINMGTAMQNKGDLEAAIENYKKALKINPDYAEVYNNMGIVLKDKGDPEAAIENYKKALKINPDYAEVYNNMGIVLNDKGDPEAAIDSYKQALKIKPDYVEVYNNMGNALNDKGDSEAAINSYKQALKINPDYADAYNNMGLVLLYKGDPEAAIDSYKQALKIKPDYVDAYCNVLRSSTGSLQPQTLEYLEKVFLRIFKTNENSIIAKFARANLLRHQRKTDLSFKLFCEANKLKKASLETELHSVQVRQKNILEKIKKWKPNKNQLTTNSIKKIFILAPSRSGKTSLEKILRRSKLVHPFYEGVKKNSKIFRDENGKDTFIKQEHRQENYLLTDIFFGNEDQLKSDGYQIVTCTNPDLISAIINLSDLVSNSYFIYVSREQEDLAPEIFIKEYSSGNYHSYDPHSIMVYLRWYKEVWKEFAKKSRDRAFVVSFENVVKSPDEVILGVENFLATDLGIDPIKMNNFNFLRDNEFHNHFKNVLKMVDDRQI